MKQDNIFRLSAAEWMHRNARPLDLARWEYHFNKGSAEDVLTALSYYQNQDGGFGHALEADSWNPHSAPVQTARAAEILDEMGVLGPAAPLVKKMNAYLESGHDFVQNRWALTVASNGEYPCAEWWLPATDSQARREFNPTAELVGFALKTTDPGGALYGKMLALAQNLLDVFAQMPDIEFHPLKCVLSMIKGIKESSAGDRLSWQEAEKTGWARVSALLARDSENWHAYGCRPSLYLGLDDARLFGENHELAAREVRFLQEAQREDGVWDIPWRWKEYPRAFAISEQWWKGDLAIKNVRFAHSFGRFV